MRINGRVFLRRFLVSAVLGGAGVSSAAAQAPNAVPRTGWEVNGLPALNFDADEGFGYGLIGQLYKYGRKATPYEITIQPTAFFTTKGRRDFTVFVDAPHAFGGNWRVDAYAGKEEQLSTPYYGIGNATESSELLKAAPNEYYYRYGRKRSRFLANIQHPLWNDHLRVLGGFGLQSVAIDDTPFDKGTTLLAAQSDGLPQSNLNYARAGLVWDTRDVETGTHSGTWADFLVQRFDKKIGSTMNYTRTTGTVRHYRPLTTRLVFASRVVAQNVAGDVPFHDLATIQSSYKEAEGLGGSSTVRGMPKNRYIGKGLLIGNTELRWTASKFSVRGKSSALILNAFADGGRVWEEKFAASGEAGGLHLGYGGGARLALGTNFIIAIDAAHSSQSTAPIYIGLGYMF